MIHKGVGWVVGRIDTRILDCELLGIFIFQGI